MMGVRWMGAAALVLLAGLPDPGTALAKKKSDGKAHVVAAFEGGLGEEQVSARHAELACVEGGKQRDGRVLRIDVAAGREWADVSLAQVPRDVRPMRTLRFWVKGDGDADHRVVVRVLDDGEDGLEHTIVAPPTEWTQVELRLGVLPARREFRPTRVIEVAFIWFGPRRDRTLFVDDVEFVEGEGGWRLSDEEMAAHIFGEKRVRKVKRKQTKHFSIWMDTKAASRKFPKELEKAYERVKGMLGLEDWEGRLPVYIFQNPGGYWKFCERHLGWDLKSAQASAGHGSSLYFATYFQGNKTPTVTHELTHSMVHRVLGWGGGSWFQEGAAVYCEELDNKKSAAKVFSPLVRNKSFVPLREFVVMDRLIDSEDPRGGARTADTLYAQAGAVFEFLLRCPHIRGDTKAFGKGADPTPAVGERLQQIARLEEEGETLLAAVERIYGMPVEDIQRAWVAWGSKPPKHPDRPK